MLPPDGDAHLGPEIDVLELVHSPLIDGELSKWEDFAWTAGTWDLLRVKAQAYPRGSILLDSGYEPPGTPLTADDLSAEHFLAWHFNGMISGVRARDNVHDIGSALGNSAELQQRDSVAFPVDSRYDGNHLDDFDAAI